ncbi:MAG: ferredoxin family protein [Planctomycetaceae bacterium]|nr:ferredoxin family protein [Planctomycetaceae bacterium]
MQQKRIVVAICQAQGRHPDRRRLEADIMSYFLDGEDHTLTESAAAEGPTGKLAGSDIHVTLLPHLYDMTRDHSGMEFLRTVPGPIIVMGWLYERAIRWTLDRAGVHGQVGETLLKYAQEEDEDAADEVHEPRGIGSVDVPNRMIYCLDLRASESAEDFIQELRRIIDDVRSAALEPQFDLMDFIKGRPSARQLERYLNPQRQLHAREAFDAGAADPTVREALPEDTRRRWYPVIDYSRCTNCMECIDFCLFGVYGVDALDRILVEEQDNCKKGCPACSRVCPENAIIFPHHKSPAIAGADGEVGGIKIDLSRLFGGDDGASALETAVLERDRELILAGRDAVGMSVGIKSRQPDELDDLMNALDSLEF